MPLPSTGSISMSQVRTELGASGQISLGQTSVRNLAGVSSGAIGMSNLRGKSSYVAMTGQGFGDDVYGDSRNKSGTMHAFPYVNISGGSGTYNYAWSFTQNTSGMGITNASTRTPTVSRSFQANQSAVYSAYLQCVITDPNKAGSSLTISNILVTMEASPAF